MSKPTPGDVSLSATLAALASPVRLAILRELRAPRTLSDIRVAAEDEEADRPLSRQAVRQHLDRLLEVGAVARIGPESASPAYLIEHRKLFGASEELRNLAALRPLGDAGGDVTEMMTARREGNRPPGPRLVIVRGLGEGSVFKLDGKREAWVIGRRREAEVPLDYDPFVSSENAIVRREKGAHTLQDLPGSRNGTLLNFARLGAEPAPLRHGDVISVGHSSLVYWTD